METKDIRREIMRLIYIHRRLERDWTGVSLYGKKEGINPHTERVKVLLEVLSFMGD